MNPAQEERIEELTTQLKKYSGIQLELFKLRTVERVSEAGSSLLTSLVLCSVLVISVFFLSLAMAFYLSQVLGNTILGFALTGGFYLFITLILLLIKKNALTTPLKNKIISSLTINNLN